MNLRILLKESMRTYKSGRTMSVMSLVVSFLLLALLGISTVFTVFIFHTIDRFKGTLEVNIYIGEDIPELTKQEMKELLGGLAGVESVNFINKEKTKTEFEEDFPEYSELLGLFPQIPLPESYRLKLRGHWYAPELINSLIEKVMILPGVEEVYFGENWLVRLEKIIPLVLFIDFFFLILVFFTIVFSIFQASKLAVISRRKVIDIMGLVGATPVVIKSPFVINGTVMGLLSGIMASLLVFCVMFIFERFLNLYFYGKFYILLALPALSVFLALIGTRAALKEL